MDVWLTDMYRRLGERYFLVALPVAAASGLLGVGIGYVQFLGLLDPDASARQLLTVAGVVVVAATAALGVSALLIVPRLRRVLRNWLDNPTEESAPAAWSGLVGLPARSCFIGVLIFSAFFIPVAIWVGAEFDLPWSHVPWIYGGIEVAILFSAVLDYFVLERMMRAALNEIANYLPEDFEPRPAGPSLGARLLAVTLIVSVTSGVLVASVAAGTHSTATRMAIGLGFGLGVAGTVGLLPTSFLLGSVVSPVRALAGAARKVEEGDLHTTIPVVARDETAVIARSFNRMVRGLRERSAELQASRARLVAATDEERRRMERDLHDGAQQHLVLVRLKLGLLERELGDTHPAADNLFGEVRGDLDKALEELRNLAHGIYPASLKNDGLVAALAEAAGRSTLPTAVNADGLGRHSPQLEAAIYFCCLEALQNAGKYAGEDAKVRIGLREDGRHLRFEVADDGAGFDPSQTEGSAGLQNMADRIGALGGELRVDSAPGRGTIVAGVVPLEGQNDPGLLDAARQDPAGF